MPNEYPTVLHDPTVLCVNLSEAAKLLGIAKSTATVQVQRRGYLLPEVPVFKIGSLIMVATAHLRSVLAIPQPWEGDDAE